MQQAQHNKAKALKITKCLPAYFGGKRKLAQIIFNSIPTTTKNVLVDPMGGSMVIPLVAKHKGYKVFANDRMYGPFIVGQGLIANSSAKIDIASLEDLIKESNNDHFINNTYGGIHLPYELATLADNMYGNIMQLAAAEQYVHLAMLYKFLTNLAPYQLYRYKALVGQFYKGTFQKSMSTHINKWKTVIQNPLPMLKKISQQTNMAICKGTASIYNMDVFKFLQQSKGDVLYLDPPYAGAKVNYEGGYHIIDSMLLRKEQRFKRSTFNDLSQERDNLKKLFTYSQNYSVTAFSYWSKEHDDDWFMQLFEECGLKGERIYFNYRYTYSTKIGVTNKQVGVKGDWSEERRKELGALERLYILTRL